MNTNIPTCPECLARKIEDLQLELDKLNAKESQLMQFWKDTEEHEIDLYTVTEEAHELARFIRLLKQNQ